MVDLHCHILPDVDDGSDCPDTSCRMAAMAADCGVRYIVATPHCNNRGMQKNYRSEELLQEFTLLQQELDRWGIPVTILPGCEVLARENLPELLEKDLLLPINGSRYLLVEFYFNESPEAMTRYLEMILRSGRVPVVAHPERYYCVQDIPSLAESWTDLGCVLQLNKGSILGDLGESAYDAAALLLRRGLASVIASDAHHYRRRTPDMSRLLAHLARRFPEVDPEPLVLTNPTKIAKDLAL